MFPYVILVVCLSKEVFNKTVCIYTFVVSGDLNSHSLFEGHKGRGIGEGRVNSYFYKLQCLLYSSFLPCCL